VSSAETISTGTSLPCSRNPLQERQGRPAPATPRPAAPGPVVRAGKRFPPPLPQNPASTTRYLASSARPQPRISPPARRPRSKWFFMSLFPCLSVSLLRYVVTSSFLPLAASREISCPRPFFTGLSNSSLPPASEARPCHDRQSQPRPLAFFCREKWLKYFLPQLRGNSWPGHLPLLASHSRPSEKISTCTCPPRGCRVQRIHDQIGKNIVSAPLWRWPRVTMWAVEWEFQPQRLSAAPPDLKHLRLPGPPQKHRTSPGLPSPITAGRLNCSN